MTFEINADGGFIRFNSLAILWQNQDIALDFPGFTVFSSGEYSLELGAIDNGNGVFITKYNDGDIEYSRPLLQF
jgi:hypothetical protein